MNEFLYSNLTLPTNLRLFFVFGSPLPSPPLLSLSPLPLTSSILANSQSTLFVRKTKLRNPKHLLLTYSYLISTYTHYTYSNLAIRNPAIRNLAIRNPAG